MNQEHEDSLFFAQRGFGQEIGYGQRPALLVIGFRAVVVREAVADRSAAAHRQSLFDLHAKYADVVGLSSAMTYLEALT